MATRNIDIEDSAAGQQDAVDQWVAHVLRDQPPFAAPATLEERVFAAIAATAAVHWWQQPLLRWPVAARLAFIAVSLGCVWLGLALAGFASLFVGGVDGATHAAASLPGYAWARALFDTASILTVVLRTVAGSLPQLWLLGGLMLIGLLYASFFGLGAVGYRAFRPSR